MSPLLHRCLVLWAAQSTALGSLRMVSWYACVGLVRDEAGLATFIISRFWTSIVMMICSQIPTSSSPRSSILIKWSITGHGHYWIFVRRRRLNICRSSIDFELGGSRVLLVEVGRFELVVGASCKWQNACAARELALEVRIDDFANLKLFCFFLDFL